MWCNTMELCTPSAMCHSEVTQRESSAYIYKPKSKTKEETTTTKQHRAQHNSKHNTSMRTKKRKQHEGRSKEWKHTPLRLRCASWTEHTIHRHARTRARTLTEGGDNWRRKLMSVRLRSASIELDVTGFVPKSVLVWIVCSWCHNSSQVSQSST